MMIANLYDLFLRYCRPTRKTPRLLVVDDEPHIRNIIEGILGHAFEVFRAESGPKAKAILQSSPDQFDVVLLDITLPGITGDQWVLPFLKLNPKLSIIMLGSHQDTPDQHKFSLENGAVDIIPKPFDHRHLCNQITKLALGKISQLRLPQPQKLANKQSCNFR